MILSKHKHANKPVLHVLTTYKSPQSSSYKYIHIHEYCCKKVLVHLKSRKKNSTALKYTYKCFGFCTVIKKKRGGGGREETIGAERKENNQTNKKTQKHTRMHHLMSVSWNNQYIMINITITTWYTFSSNISQSIGYHSSASETSALHSGDLTTSTPHPTNHHQILHRLDQACWENIF